MNFSGDSTLWFFASNSIEDSLLTGFVIGHPGQVKNY